MPISYTITQLVCMYAHTGYILNGDFMFSTSCNIFTVYLSLCPTQTHTHTHTHTHMHTHTTHTHHTRTHTHTTHTHTTHTHHTHTQCGMTALDVALQSGNDEVVMTLLDNANN